MCTESASKIPIDTIDAIANALGKARGIVYCAHSAIVELHNDNEIADALWAAQDQLEELREQFRKLHP